MSQDNETCVKCGTRCGYEDGKSVWLGEKRTHHDTAICVKCTNKIINEFIQFFGTVPSYTKMGIELQWDEVVKILDRIRNDVIRKVHVIETTDREAYDSGKRCTLR